ncbi:MAG: adenylate/guanylate cyclase domain-containing protein [Acidimicrobiales bacterium]|nr:adenylate/guanylate cyclase domain-containing protein [Acidimicrobiales bacterium]
MTGDGQPFGYVVVDPGSPGEATRPLHDRIFVGRECAGVDDSHRILLGDDLAVSRNHLEIRVDPELSKAVVVDTSSNGVRVNGIRIERAVGVPLNSGDQIQVGSHVLEFRGGIVTTRPEGSGQRSTVSVATPMTMAMIVGDLINFSTVSEQADQQVLVRDVHHLYTRLRELLAQHKGTLVDYVGDAFFASWELDVDPVAAANALRFALAADELASQCTADFELRYADGTPLRMGWGAVMGPVVMQLMPGSVVMVLGDAVNLGFRISSIAGREGRPNILATESVRQAADGAFSFGDPETVTVKGRVGIETIYGVSAR